MNHGKPELSLADSPPFIRLVRLVNLPSPFVITKLHFGANPIFRSFLRLSLVA